MKTKISTISILFIAFALIFNSCKKEDAASAVDQIIPTKIKAKIDGVDWNSKVQTVKLITATNYFTIAGTSVGGDIVSITIKGKEVKEYKLVITLEETTIQFEALYTLATAASDAYAAKEGSVTLTKVDLTNKLISGTFQFKMKNATLVDKVVTDGSFTDLSYSETASK